MANKQVVGFRAYMPSGESYGYIQFYQWALILRKVNTRKCYCKECKNQVEAGGAIYHRAHYDNGFVCLRCAMKMILKFGAELGFRENIICNLQCCYFGPGTFTADAVVASIRRIEEASLSTPLTSPQMEPMLTSTATNAVAAQYRSGNLERVTKVQA